MLEGLRRSAVETVLTRHAGHAAELAEEDGIEALGVLDQQPVHGLGRHQGLPGVSAPSSVLLQLEG